LLRKVRPAGAVNLIGEIWSDYTEAVHHAGKVGHPKPGLRDLPQGILFEYVQACRI